MNETLADIFLASDTIDTFKELVMTRDGEYPFGPGDMLALGNAYFTRYPEYQSNRNSDHIRIGYQVVMISMVEKLLRSVDSGCKAAFREMFYNVAGIQVMMRVLVNERGHGPVQSALRIIEEHLEEINEAVIALERGHVKERFVGALSNLFNIIYIMKKSLRDAEHGDTNGDSGDTP